VYSSKYSLEARLLTSLACIGLGSGCWDPDPRTIEGAIEAAAVAVEHDDAPALYLLIDVRTRHALAGIVDARSKARTVIQRDYPKGEVGAALARLGPPAATAAELFALRCDSPCLADFAGKLGAPERTEKRGNVTVVTTVRGTRLDMYSVDGGWYGLVWRTDEYIAERDRASRDLAQIEDNAAVYRRRNQLSQ